MKWLDELLEEAEKAEKGRKLEMDKIRCDQALQTIKVLQQKTSEVEAIAAQETKLIEDWKAAEVGKLQRQIDWLAGQCENFIRSSDQKTIVLPHGSLHLRLGRPKVTIIDEATFTPIGQRLGLIKIKPSTTDPDLNAIHAYVRRVGSVPPGIAYTPATVGFTFKTKGTNNNGTEQREQQAQAGGNGESGSAEAAA